MPATPAVPTQTGPARLLTPGLAWLVGGLVLALVAVVLLVLLRPTLPGVAFEQGVGPLALSAISWLGGLFGVGCGLGAAGNGLLLLASYDRAEASLRTDGAPLPPVPLVGRLASRGFVAVMALLGATAIGIGALAWPDARDGVSVPLLLVAGVLVGVAIRAVGTAYLAARRPGPPIAERARPLAPVGLANPVRHLEVGLLVLLVIVAIALQLTLIRWVVEDAAISYAYARHLAAGDGLVTYPGGERVEGYSNPLWTFLMAGFYLVGVDGWASSKLMAGLFGALTVPLVWAIAREARPHRSDATPLLAAAILAGSAQFAIWSAGGLENSLLNVLIAAAIWRGLVEARRGGVPWSALLWVGVAVTRPEGILYAAIGGFWSMVFHLVLASPRVREAREAGEPLGPAVWAGVWPTLAWLTLFFVPFGLYQIWRINYFAWEFPNTYYAKKGNPTKAFEPFEWKRRGWKYVRQFGHQLWHGYLLPVYVIGLLGVRGLRGGVAAVALLALGVVLLVPGPEILAGRWWWTLEVPEWWVVVRVWTLLAVAVLSLPFVVGRPGWRALVLCEGVAVAAVFFAVYAGGDWMNGFRWFATVIVPASVLLAVGIAEAADVASRFERVRWLGMVLAGVLGGVALVYAVGLFAPPVDRIKLLGLTGRDPDKWVLLAVPVVLVAGAVIGWRSTSAGNRVGWGSAGWTVAMALLAVVTIPSVHELDRFLGKPTTSPASVRKRVNYMNWAQARLHIDGQPTTLDVDMGANMYWSNDKIVDIAGLVDVSMGHHWFETDFMAEYLFAERKPDFAHVHGGWARTSKIDRFDEWKEQYVAIPPYPTGKRGQHGGNHVRKDHIVRPRWEGPAGREVSFDSGVTLAGWDVPAGEGAPGHHLYVEVALQTERERQEWDLLRTVVFLSGPGGIQSWDVPPGYDWYSPADWERGEVVLGRYSLRLPDDLALGDYSLGLVLIEDPAGEILQPVGRTGAEPVYARGEVVFDSAVRIVDADTLVAHSDADRAAALAAAEAGQCDEAERRWLLARRRLTRTEYDETHRAGVGRGIARCWALQVPTLPRRATQVEAVERARSWDFREPTTLAAGAALADRLFVEAEAARAAKDWESAYEDYHDVLRVDPTRSWARRWAEQARDCRLRIRLDQHDCGDVGGGMIPLPDARPRPTPATDLEAPVLELGGDEANDEDE